MPKKEKEQRGGHTKYRDRDESPHSVQVQTMMLRWRWRENHDDVGMDEGDRFPQNRVLAVGVDRGVEGFASWKFVGTEQNRVEVQVHATEMK